MRKHLNTLILILCFTGATIWGAQQLQFFERLPVSFSQIALAARNEGGGNGGGQRGRGHGRQGAATSEEHETSGLGGQGRGRGNHAITASLEGWINVLAYLSIFAFVIMATYYAELGIRLLLKRKEGCPA